MTETPIAVGSDTYTLSCTGVGGTGSDSTTLTVNAPPAQAYAYILNNAIFGNPGTITAYSESSADGTLTLLPDSPYNSTLFDPIAIAVDAPQNLLFVAGNASGTQTTGEIDAFVIDPSTGSLASSAPVVTTPPDSPTDIAIGPSGNFLYVASHSGDSVTAYSIAANGALTEVSGSPYTIPGTNCGLFCEATADALVYDANAQTLYVTGIYGWYVATFTVNPTSGALTWVYNTDTDGVPTSVAVNPAGTYVYSPSVSNVGGSAVVNGFSVTTSATSSGNPEPLTPVAGQPFTTANTPSGSAIDPTGTYLYVAEPGENAVSAFKIGSGGVLTAVSGSPFAITGGSADPNSLVVDPSGQYLYVMSEQYNSGSLGAVTAFTINRATGALTEFTSLPYSASNNVGPFAIVVYKIP